MNWILSSLKLKNAIEREISISSYKLKIETNENYVLSYYIDQDVSMLDSPFPRFFFLKITVCLGSDVLLIPCSRI